MGDLQTDQGESLELQLRAGERVRAPARRDRRRQSARAAAFAALARINTLYMIAGAWSGHIGTSFSSLEIMSWLFLNEMRDLDKGADACDIFFSSKGHDAPALYNVLIGLGLLPRRQAPPAAASARAARPSARRDAVHPGEHRLARHGHLEGEGHGAGQPARPARERRIFVLTGDGELQEGQFWESLGIGRQPSASARSSPSSTTTRFSRTPGCSDVSQLGDLEAKFRAFGWHVSALRRSRRRGARAHVPRARRRDGPAEGHHRRHRQGQGRVLHGRARR